MKVANGGFVEIRGYCSNGPQAAVCGAGELPHHWAMPTLWEVSNES
jgi:hypothetical protein